MSRTKQLYAIGSYDCAEELVFLCRTSSDMPAICRAFREYGHKYIRKGADNCRRDVSDGFEPAVIALESRHLYDKFLKLFRATYCN